MKPITVTLAHPIEAHGETLSDLTLKPPTLGVLEGIEIVAGEGGVRFNLGDLHKLIADMAGILPSAARAIHLSDLSTLGPAVMDFFASFPPTAGGT